MFEQLKSKLQNQLSTAQPAVVETALKEFEKFEEVGVPGRRVEKWKYNDLKFLKSAGFQELQLQSADAETEILGGYELLSVASHQLEQTAELLNQVPGVTARVQWVEKSTDMPVFAHHPLFFASRAVATKELVVDIEKNTVLDQPLCLIHRHSVASSFQAFQLSLNVQSGAEAQLVFLVDDIAEGSGVVSGHVNIGVANNAKCEFLKLGGTKNTRQFVTQKMNVAADGRLHAQSFDIDTLQTRNDVDVQVNGTGADVKLDGLYVAGEGQEIDNHVSIAHNQPHCESEQLFKGILDKDGHGIFNGRIFVAQDAQKTDSSQLNKNMLLSDRASVDTKPELEIFADDVKAAHGAAIGELNKEELFYMLSRAIPRTQAIQLLGRGFGLDVIERSQSGPAREWVEQRLDAFLAQSSILEGL